MEVTSSADDVCRDGPAPPASVYLVDDHEHVRMTLVEYIDEADGFHVVGSSGSAVEAVAEIVRLQPRIAVVDGRLADCTGLDVCRDLGASAPNVSCVILTSAVALNWGPVEAAEAGAVAFVVKRLRDFDLLDVMVRVVHGERPIDDARLVSFEAAADQVEGANR